MQMHAMMLFYRVQEYWVLKVSQICFVINKLSKNKTPILKKKKVMLCKI